MTNNQTCLVSIAVTWRSEYAGSTPICTILSHSGRISLLTLRVLCFSSLEPLPFRDREFDMVRIQNIGLGVPEDEVCSF